jgi:sterol desaturase/sphingolipid hydroxylase (fatty acid hydroxylase superfamily)
LRAVVSHILWPLLFGGAVAAFALGTRTAHPVVAFNVSYLALALALMGLERAMPYEKRWLKRDGQLIPDLGHTLLSKTAVQILIVSLSVIGIVELAGPDGAPWWPSSWPLALQVVLGLIVAEFGFYWAHRLAHEWPLLWRFHAVHHSVTRLWVVNTGRFHFVDTIVSVTFGLSMGLICGVPEQIIVWVSAITAFVGLLTHCNVDMRFGLLNHVVNTPGLHRWHHSMVPDEGNRNYGENLMLFDQLFGTYINPDRHPPVEIGVREAMPETLAGQIAFPFRTTGAIEPVAE